MSMQLFGRGALLLLLVGCGSSARETPERCLEGALRCDGLELSTCVDGEYQVTETCADMCNEEAGCGICAPGTGTCEGNVAKACNNQGTGFTETTCDPVQGMGCDNDIGQCTGPCSPGSLGTSYIGCEYFPTVTGNMVGSVYNFAVAVANTSSTAANVTIEDGGMVQPIVFTVPGNSVVVRTLPWQEELKLCNGPSWSNCSGGVQKDAALAQRGAFHLRSTSPVTVYQFNPLEYEIEGVFEPSYTNDASLLLPTNVWRDEYYAASWQNTAGVNPSLLAVTAWQDNTLINLTSTALVVEAGGAPPFMPGETKQVTLNAGDVIEITTRTGDLTGSHVSSDKPVQMIGGHYCANVPDLSSACDHIEESMISLDAMGKTYLVNSPALPTLPDGKITTTRIIATRGGTTLTYQPPLKNVPTEIANAGEFVEIETVESFMITASEKVLVAQYMQGQSQGGGAGDPSMALAVPIEQFRDDYLFHAPTNYTSNYVDVTAPVGAVVMLDGAPVELLEIGKTGFGLARVQLDAGPTGDGNHSIKSDDEFGISVYGYGQWTSYWYPGGLNLKDVVE